MPLQFEADDIDYMFGETMEERIADLKRFLGTIVNELVNRFDYHEGESMIRVNVKDPWVYNVMMNDFRMKWFNNNNVR